MGLERQAVLLAEAVVVEAVIQAIHLEELEPEAR